MLNEKPIGKIFDFKKSQTNFLYATYLCIGGLAFESKINLKLKILYYVWQVSCLIFGSFASFVWFYQLCHRQKPTFQQFFTFAISFNNPIAGLIADSIAYSFRNRIRLVLREIDNDFNIKWKHTNRHLGDKVLSKKLFNVGRTFLLFFILGNVLMIIFLGSRLTAVIFSGQIHINDMYYFLFAVPMAEKVDTMAEYMVINTFQIIMSAAILLKGLLIPLFFLSIGGILSNQFVLLTEDLANESKWFQQMAETKFWKPTQYILSDAGQRFCGECIFYLNNFRHLMRYL